MTDETSPYQYATSTDPDVIAAVQRNLEGRRDVHRRACEFSQKYGSDTDGAYYDGSFAGRHRPSAIGGNKPTVGRWKKGPGGYGWLPYKTNPISEEFNAIDFRDEPVPGMPTMMRGPGKADWSHTLYSLSPFVSGRAAWVGVSGPVLVDDHYPGFGSEWTEVLPSAFHAAREALD